MSDLMAELGITVTPAQQETVVHFPLARTPDPQWERCKPWVESTLSGELMKIETIENCLRDGRFTLWPGKACAIVTEIMSYDGGSKAMQTVAAGGDLAEILSMMPGIEAAARVQGCTVGIIEGRKGWEKLLKERGYVFHSVTLRKVL